jgi:hypothetical protein
MTPEEEAAFRVQEKHDAEVKARLAKQSRGGLVNLIPADYDVADMIEAERAADVYRVFRAGLRLGDPKRDDRHVLALLLAYQMMKSGPAALLPLWQQIHATLMDSSPHYS